MKLSRYSPWRKTKSSQHFSWETKP